MRRTAEVECHGNFCHTYKSYSASTGGFYETRVHTQIPDDAVFVSRADHAALMEAQAAGGRIVPSPETRGPVVDVSYENPEAPRSRLIVSVKREAERRILAISPLWRQLNDQRAPSDDTFARFAAIDAVRQASNHIEAEICAADAAYLSQLDIAAHSRWSA